MMAALAEAIRDGVHSASVVSWESVASSIRALLARLEREEGS